MVEAGRDTWNAVVANQRSLAQSRRQDAWTPANCEGQWISCFSAMWHAGAIQGRPLGHGLAIHRPMGRHRDFPRIGRNGGPVGT
jgi:hypothetical protein